MTYQYLFCATCGLRRVGHAYRCSVCDGLLRRPDTRRRWSVLDLRPVVRAEAPKADNIKQPVAA